MAAYCPEPAVEYFSIPTAPAPANISISPYPWEQSQHPTALLPSPELYDSSYSTLPSPTEPTALKPLGATLDQDTRPQRIFDFGSCEDWASWDEPTDSPLSSTTIDFFPEVKMEPTTSNVRGLEAHSVLNQLQKHSTTPEETAVFGDDQMDQPLFLANESPREGLYSTPLSWSPPSASTNISKQEPYDLSDQLSPRQKSRLIAQAMPSRSRVCHSSTSSASSPEPEQGNHGRKRKSTSYASDEEEEESPRPAINGQHQPVKKTAHNMIEKRYRTNLNDKIAALRDSVPSLRVITKRDSRGEEVREDLDGLTPAHKLNKATVLSKATEYISHLERRNKALTKENSILKSRAEAFETLVMARDPQSQQQQRHALQQQQMRSGRTHSRQAINPRYAME